MTQPDVDISALDVGHLAMFVGLAVSEEVIAALKQQGHPRLRFSHGFVFQHLMAMPPTVSGLARLLEVTQQSASKTVAELKRLGYVTLRADEKDGRAMRVVLSKKGWD